MSERPIDMALAGQPLTKADAYLILSKLRRLSVSLTIAMSASLNDDNAEVRKQLVEAFSISDEVDALVDDLVLGVAGKPDES